jgi:uncharacterized protein YcbK (DUF882 family)
MDEFKAIHFKKSEFTCRCGCGKNNIDQSLVSRLDEVREIFGAPIVISSGCRCEKHNAAEGGVHDSAHVLGLAADIRVTDSAVRFHLLSILMHRFERIGIAKTFIHVDVDQTKPRQVAWLY